MSTVRTGLWLVSLLGLVSSNDNLQRAGTISALLLALSPSS